MFPKGIFINLSKNKLIIFEKDFDNPENEGFVCYWQIDDHNVYKLIFKKRLTKEKANEMFNNLTKEGWSLTQDKYNAA